MDKFIYAVRDTKTGKLVNDLTSHPKKYWDTKAGAVKAIKKEGVYGKHLRLVTFKLEEIAEQALLDVK